MINNYNQQLKLTPTDFYYNVRGSSENILPGLV